MVEERSVSSAAAWICPESSGVSKKGGDNSMTPVGACKTRDQYDCDYVKRRKKTEINKTFGECRTTNDTYRNKTCLWNTGIAFRN